MPYNPHVVDRSGEYIARGISSFGDSLSGVLKQMGERWDEEEMLRTQMGGPAGQSGTEMNPGQVDLSMFGVPEGANQGTGEGNATAEDQAKSAAKVTKALRDLGEHGYGYDRNTLETMGLPELRGLARRAEMQSMQQERQVKLQHIMGQMAAQDEAAGQRVALGKFWDKLVGSQPTRQSVTGRVGMDGERIAGADGTAGGAIPLSAVWQAMGESGYRPEPEKIDNFLGLMEKLNGGAGGPPIVDNVDLPNGYKGAVLRGSKDLKLLPDVTREPVEVRPGLYQDAKGNLRQFKDKAAADGSLLPVLDPLTKEPLKGFGMDATGKVHDFRSEVEKKVGDMGKPAAKATPAPLAEGPARPMSQAEFEALPKGATYINPKDGKLYTKK